MLLARTETLCRSLATASAGAVHRALAYRQCGDPLKELAMEHVAAPPHAPGVLVRMLAAPVNPADINQIQGTYPLAPLPLASVASDAAAAAKAIVVAGNEGVGVVVRVTAVPGAAPCGLAVGDWVIPAAPGLGTWREELVCAPEHLFKVEGLSLEAAATLLINPATAYRLLRDFVALSPGDVLIQNGANSAVGRAVIQLAAAAGIRTVNVVRDRPDFEGAVERDLYRLGATLVVKSERLALPETQEYILARLGGGARPVLGLNCVGGQAASDLLHIMADGSTLVTYGAMGRRPLSVGAGPLIFRDVRLAGFWMSRWYLHADAAARSAMLDELVKMCAAGQLLPPPLQEFRFADQWQEAIARYAGAPSAPAGHKPLLLFGPKSGKL